MFRTKIDSTEMLRSLKPFSLVAPGLSLKGFLLCGGLHLGIVLMYSKLEVWLSLRAIGIWRNLIRSND